MEIREIGDATLYLADNMEILPTLYNMVDAVIMDPPYGLDFQGKRSESSKANLKLYEDNEHHYKNVLLPRIRIAITTAKGGRAAVFCGHKRMWEYPPPTDIGGIFSHGSTSISEWGFRCFSPVLFYGKSPYMSGKEDIGGGIMVSRGGRPTAKVIVLNAGSMERKGNPHPCPKPLEYMNWLVETASLEGETVLDPFMGSGTTGEACVRLNRKFIGIELDKEYFEFACQRIERAMVQMRKIAPSGEPNGFLEMKYNENNKNS